MTFTKKFDNGLRLVIEKIDGLFSVSTGVLVRTGSANESAEENGISHFIEHTFFKGTSTRTAFEISDYVDRIGAYINAYTSKEITCYYTKSTAEHAEETLEVLSDLMFNATFDSAELEKEKGVIIEEINMSEDSAEDILYDTLAEGFYGKKGYGRTILGPVENIKRFTRDDVLSYLDKYYTADNMVISVAGNVDVEKTILDVERYFVSKIKRFKSEKQYKSTKTYVKNKYRYKKIEQSHIGIAMPGVKLADSRYEALAIANVVLGGGMSSRLFQKIREEDGLAYSVYSSLSLYKDQGIIEVYAGVNPEQRDVAFEKIIEEIKKFKKDKISEQEFLRGKEQLKSSFVMGRESTASQMQVFGKYMLYFDEVYSVDTKLARLNSVTKEEVCEVIDQLFNFDKMTTATVGPKRSALVSLQVESF